MDFPNVEAIPTAELAKLAFLAGEFTGTQEVFPPDGSDPFFMRCVYCGEWAPGDRFFRMQFVGLHPLMDHASSTNFVTFRRSQNRFRVWSFIPFWEEPLVGSAIFEGAEFVLTSPAPHFGEGITHVRIRFSPLDEGIFEILGEVLTPLGYARLLAATFRREEN